jgi:predicted nucleotidyltransferase
MSTILIEKETLQEAANLLRSLGASQVFVFGSAVSGELRSDSDIDMAVTGLPAQVYFSVVSKASDLLGRPVDLVDLDDDTPLVRHLLESGDLVCVGDIETAAAARSAAVLRKFRNSAVRRSVSQR